MRPFRSKADMKPPKTVKKVSTKRTVGKDARTMEPCAFGYRFAELS